MKSISKNITNEIIINKSKFITKLIKVNNLDEVKNKLDLINEEYKDATHICYAYIVDNVKRMSDNGEPGGTAGMPILNVLEKNDLNYILAVVIRYFGGIKLGAGGLVRAYSSSVSKALELCEILDLVDGYKVLLRINYDKVKTIDNLLKKVMITYKEFDEIITYEIIIEKDNPLLELLKDNSLKLEIIENVKLTKKM